MLSSIKHINFEIAVRIGGKIDAGCMWEGRIVPPCSCNFVFPTLRFCLFVSSLLFFCFFLQFHFSAQKSSVRPSVRSCCAVDLLLFSPFLKMINAAFNSEFWLNFKKVIIGGPRKKQAIRHCGEIVANCNSSKFVHRWKTWLGTACLNNFRIGLVGVQRCHLYTVAHFTLLFLI